MISLSIIIITVADSLTDPNNHSMIPKKARLVISYMTVLLILYEVDRLNTTHATVIMTLQSKVSSGWTRRFSKVHNGIAVGIST